MRDYLIYTFSKAVHELVSSIEKSGTSRGYSYMARGALISLVEGNFRAIHDIIKICEWGQTHNHISVKEIQFLRNVETQYFSNQLESTALQNIPGKVHPWQGWATTKIEKKGGRHG
ncbi:MAG: hypothetical protein JXR95_10505 [Deltaproteobacteria bacterium]|nr:hypothetical protein [Deltaproteobacteria bacterium]